MNLGAQMPRPWHWVVRTLVVTLLLSLSPQALAQQGKDPPPRDAHYRWNWQKKQLFMGVSFRDVIDSEIRKKLSRGFTTTIVLTGAVYQPGVKDPLSTTAQTCKITWHVWDEIYLIEITRPGSSASTATPTVGGVLRRCAEVSNLLVATSDQVPVGTPIYVTAKVQVNPVSDEILAKLKRWVSRPTGTGTATPGDALFSTFTGLFLQRIGDAERELKFTTKTATPAVEKPPPPPPKKP